MVELSITTRLRPTRIGFLVHPTDLNSVKKIMRTCACLWGGVYNPLIPVFRSRPRIWKKEVYERFTAADITRGYIKYFEPDVFVEAEPNMLEKAGLGALREKRPSRKFVVSLDSFLSPEDARNPAEPTLGLSIVDVLRYLYKTERRFVLRENANAVLVKPQLGSGLSEAIFGAYPERKDAEYFSSWYKNVFHPAELPPTPSSWIDAFEKNAMTPLRVTRHDLEPRRYWHHNLVVFVFDPTSAADLIDLWNLRLEPHPVIPVPADWVQPLCGNLQKIIASEYRPIKGATKGQRHHATVEFGRSLPKEQAELLSKSLMVGVPDGSLFSKYWRTRVWEDEIEYVGRDARLQVTAGERRDTVTVKEDRHLSATIESVSPVFAARFGARDARWANALVVQSYLSNEIATVIPFNTWDRSWPRLESGGDGVSVGSEGWVYLERYKNNAINIRLLSKENAIIGSLKQFGIAAELSEPGHIAKQMLDHLGGLWSAYLLADRDTLVLLNKMAGGLRRTITESEMVEEQFDRRSVPIKDWVDLVNRRNKGQTPAPLKVSEFTRRNVIRLGVEAKCPNCQAKNWYSLSVVDYKLICERCLNSYDFPQADLQQGSRNWHYRVVGPFSVPDYARGSYSALLTLRLINVALEATNEMTFSTAMNLEFDGIKAEADFIAWRRTEDFGDRKAPDLILGETKSRGEGELIKLKDLTKLRSLARKLPGATIVISVLREHFTKNEQKLLRSLATWGRRANDRGVPTNPVVLLTANELLFEHLVSTTWEQLGGIYRTFADYKHTHNLVALANATQQIYLGLPSFETQQEAERQKRVTRRKKP
jgi:hypothetical protein